MLQAQSNKGKLVTLAQLTKEEIEFHRKETQFFCPICHHPVMIKSGSRVIPHFAHYSQTNCQSKSGGEGPYHEKGKTILYQWLKKQHIHVTLEKYIKDIQQQPDLFVRINDKKIAIEFQCSRTSIQEIQSRNNRYTSADIVPVWILGANLFNRRGKYQLKVDQFIFQFVHRFSSTFPLKLFYFCPKSMLISTFEDIYMAKVGQAIGKLHFYKLNQMNFIQLFLKDQFTKKQLYGLWKHEKKRFRLQRRKQIFGQEKTWHQWLYLQNTHIEYLPSIIHLPVKSQHMMRSSIWDWQSRLIIQIIHPRPLGSYFTITECENVLKFYQHNPDDYPLIKFPQSPIQQYLNILKQLNYIQQISEEKYIIIKEIKFHDHIEQSLINDDILINQIKQQN